MTPTRTRETAKGWLALSLACSLAAVPVGMSATAVVSPGTSALTSRATAAPDEFGVPEVLRGETWLRHLEEDLLPYWTVPEALGAPVGNFPTNRGRAGEIRPEDSTNRGVSTLAGDVYGYTVAFMMTGREEYLTYARAGLDWIEAHTEDPVHGGYFGDLTIDGEPVDPLAIKDISDLASLGLAYGMYFNATRDPSAEAGLLKVRDLIFDRYHDAAGNRFLDARTYDLATEVDTAGNGGDITNLLVPGSAVYLPHADLLTDPARRAQFGEDLRLVADSLITRHKNTRAANPANRFWFWGRTLRFGAFGSAQTTFGHNVKSYEMLHNASQRYTDRPWAALEADRGSMLARAWDAGASRWNERLRSFVLGDAEPDSGWWPHTESDQLLAALDLGSGFAYADQLARSAQAFLDVYVDRDPAYPVRETFARVERTGTMTDLRKSFTGKSMFHNVEHSLVMYLHGQAMAGEPARLHYALPEDDALSMVTKPYWFDATGERRRVGRALEALPGRRLVEVAFTGIGAVPAPPYPPPADTAGPVTEVVVSPPPNGAGWHRDDATLAFTAVDDLVGVKQTRIRVDALGDEVDDVALIEPGPDVSVTVGEEGEYEVTYSSVDVLGNQGTEQTLRIRVDRTAPALAGLPARPCTLWPPNGRLVRVADVVGADARSGVARLEVTADSDEPGKGDVLITGGTVYLRAERDGFGDGRTYTIVASVRDRAGNDTSKQATCEVPHDRGS